LLDWLKDDLEAVGMRVLVLKPGKETVILRKARKQHVCHECGGIIPKGVYYIEDRINYLRRRVRSGEGYKWYHVHKVCLLCWKGPIPKEKRVKKS